MPTRKINAVIEAVRFSPGGKIELVRAYERRGPVWSDVQVLHRAELVDRLKHGQRICSGSRIKFLGNQFDTVELLRLENDRVISGMPQGSLDSLDGVPVF
jgi:hypothetical protein